MLYAHLPNKICTAGTSAELINLGFETPLSFDTACTLLCGADLMIRWVLS